jgi:hypothetical protein
MARRRHSGKVLTWDQLDGIGLFNVRQRATIDLCIALMETASESDHNTKFEMLTYVAAFMLYEGYGAKPADIEWAVSNLGNKILLLADGIDELCRG